MWKQLIEASAVPEGTGIVAHLEGREYAVFRDGEYFRVLSNTCPHQGGPLSEGRCEAGTVICPWHGWEFDIRTGKCTFNDAFAVDAYPTKVEAGQILIQFAEEA
jgi:nitrite reductase/ring-hydroxylating ferredoxin subunit